MKATPSFYISVDVETAGPAPSLYDMLSIGACTVDAPQETFYIELQPTRDVYLQEALMISRLNFERLKEKGTPPEEAMRRFAEWVGQVTPDNAQPVFVAFNAPFDWMFVHDYFIKYLGYNPFGHKALDIKAMYMGVHGVDWLDTGFYKISQHYLGERQLTHHALRDALDQAEIFQQMIQEVRRQI